MYCLFTKSIKPRLCLQFLTMAARLRKNIDLLKVLSKAKPKLRQAILKNLDSDTVRCICECAHNVLNGNLKLTPKQRKDLLKHRKALRQLASKSGSLTTKKQVIVQKGGLVGAILGPLLAVAASLLAEKWMK